MEKWFGSGMPLGGIGTGFVEFCPDGTFRDWNIMNNQPWGAGPKENVPLDAAHFGMVADRRAMLFCRPEMRWDETLNDPYAQAFVQYPQIDAIDRWPFTELKCDGGNDFPVKVKMSVFSPFVPHDVKNSSLPGAFFTFSVTNRTDREISCSLFEAQRNLSGLSGKSRSTSEFDGSFLRLGREKQTAQNDDGDLSFGVAARTEGTKVTFCSHAKTLRDVWEPLLRENALENLDFGKQKLEIGNAGAAVWQDPACGMALSAVAATFLLAPGKTVDVTFALCWSFPDMRERHYSWKKDLRAHRIGHYYHNFFADSRAVFRHFQEKFPVLRRKTLEFRRDLEAVGMEKFLLPAITSQLSTMIRSSWLDEKGRFGIWEGLGFCGLQTIDVSLYGSCAVLDFFPELEKSQISLTAKFSDHGDIPHTMPGNFHAGDVNDLNRIDLAIDFLLIAWRDFRATGDFRLAQKLYPVIQAAWKRFSQCCTDAAGLPYHQGRDQTYDQFPIRGTAAMTGFLYTAALEGVAEFAKEMGDEETAASCEQQVATLLPELDRRLWNGEYYSLSRDLPENLHNEGVMVDQLVGDWFRRLAGAPGQIADAKRKKALRSILKYCAAPNGYLRNCAWPKNDAIQIGTHTANQADWPWSGVEYAFASELVLSGMAKEGIALAKNVFERYERTGMRYCHIECGPHYYRAMSVWSLYQALAGCWMDAVAGALSLRFDHLGKTLVVLTPLLRAKASWKDATVTLETEDGMFELKKFHYVAPDGTAGEKVFVPPLKITGKTTTILCTEQSGS
ncbi:MAG: GH116 family glycosyl hydrolase [Victivallaceae bacterium]|nr:GH116 family glycosyl hydrolase [Victivallaceae bacterium]